MTGVRTRETGQDRNVRVGSLSTGTRCMGATPQGCALTKNKSLLQEKSMNRHCLVRQAVRFAIAAAAASTSLPLFAQEAAKAAPEAEETQTIVVTGSRILRR